MLDTSWEKSGNWYKKIVGDKGHFYHQTVILPNALRLLNLKPGNSLLDLACGQGIMERSVPEGTGYLGADLSSGLIREAKAKSQDKSHNFMVADVSKPLPVRENNFSHAAIILALQNIKKPFGVIRNASEHLKTGGRFLIVLNHPVFRIPRYSSWGVDEKQKIQYRRIDGYMSHLEIPILTNPGKQKSETTWTFHYPLSSYTEMLSDNGFVIENIEEWVSPKKSTGSKAKMEDQARAEFPLFMAILAKKI